MEALVLVALRRPPTFVVLATIDVTPVVSSSWS